MNWFLKLLDNLYIVKRVLSWLFHSVGLFFLIRQRKTWGRYSAAWRYTTTPTYIYTLNPSSIS